MDTLSKVQTTVVQRSLEQTARQAPAIQLVVLATVDGFQVAAAGSRSAIEDLPEKFAAMASSMAALSEAAGRELGTKRLDVAVLDFSGLQVILRAIKGESRHFVLAVAADKSVILGNLLWAVRDCAHGIEEALR